MNIKLDLDPTAWRARGDFEGQSRANRRYFSREASIRIACFVAGLALGLGVML